MFKIKERNVTQTLVMKGYWNIVVDIVLSYKLEILKVFQSMYDMECYLVSSKWHKYIV